MKHKISDDKTKTEVEIMYEKGFLEYLIQAI